MALGDAQFISDGKAVDVSLLYTVRKGQLAVVEGWVGITGASGNSGEQVALDVSDREFIFVVPDALDALKGEIIYIDTADVTGHNVDSTAYSKTPGDGKIALCKVTRDQDDDHTVRGIMLGHNAFANYGA